MSSRSLSLARFFGLLAGGGAARALFNSSAGTFGFTAAAQIIYDRRVATVQVSRSNGSTAAVAVWVKIEDGTATRNTDYTFTNSAGPFPPPLNGWSGAEQAKLVKLTWANRDAKPKLIQLTTLNLDSDPLDLTMTIVAIVTPGNELPVTTGLGTTTVTIYPTPDEHGIVGFRRRQNSYNESQTIQVEVRRARSYVGAVSVDYHTEDGTGVEGVDYDESVGTLNWNNAETGPKYISVVVNSVTGSKTFNVILTDPTGGVVINEPERVCEVTILEVGGAGNFGFQVEEIQTTDGATLAITVQRLGGSAGAVSVDFELYNGTALAGTHYTDVSQTLNWADGDDDPQTVNVSITGDGDVPLLFTAKLEDGVGADILSSYDTINIMILPTGAPEIPSTLDFVNTYEAMTSQEMIAEDAMAWTRREITVNFMTQLVDGEIGWSDGTSIHGGGSDLITPHNNAKKTWKFKHSMSVRQVGL